MAFIPVPNAIKVSVEFLIGGQTVVITLSIGKTSAISPTDLVNANAAVFDFMSIDLMPLLSNQLSATKATAYDLTSSTAPANVRDYVPDIVGGVVDASIANNVAVVSSFRTANRGRSGRGRVYVPGIPNSVKASPVSVTTTFANNIGTAFINLSSRLAGVNLSHVVISRFLNNAPRNPGITQPITAIVMNTDMDSQRRRLAGRGI